MSLPAITVENLSKAYRIGVKEEIPDTFFAAAASWLKAPLANARRLKKLNTFSQSEESDDIIWAVKDVSFDVQEGEVLGIIGRNGAGKSTLLKILSRITEPTSGRAIIRGRISSLLEVGTGFHPELTGRENIYLNGTILGMRKKEIDRKFDEIVDFSGVERFLDTPIKRYSSGMKVRLAFAVAAHLEPEILIIDEVLAVGDQEFQKQCLGKMKDVAKSGRTVLFVSHNLAAVESLCSTAIMLESGRMEAQGKTADIIDRYLGSGTVSSELSSDLSTHPGRQNDATKLMNRVTLRNECGNAIRNIRMGETLTIEVEFSSNHRFSPVLGVVVKTSIGVSLFGIDNRISQGYVFDEDTTQGCISCHISQIPLMPGTYLLDLYLGDQIQSIDRIIEAISFQVIETDIFGSGKLPSKHCGPIWNTASWTVNTDH